MKIRENFNYKRIKEKRMTLIIGMKLKEGIILIGDRKVSTGNEHPFYDDKIEAPLEGIRIAVGAAGLRDLSKEFNRKIINKVASRTPEYELGNVRAFYGTGLDIEKVRADIQAGKVIEDKAIPYIYRAEDFLDDCSLIVRQLAEIGKEVESNPIEALVAVNTNKSSLYKIYMNGYKQEGDRFAIGSGAIHIQSFLNQLELDKLNFGTAINIGVFMIKYVELMELDDGVGVEKDRLPQIFLINNKFAKEYEFKNEEDVKEVLKSTFDRIKKIQNNFTFA